MLWCAAPDLDEELTCDMPMWGRALSVLVEENYDVDEEADMVADLKPLEFESIDFDEDAVDLERHLSLVEYDEPPRRPPLAVVRDRSNQPSLARKPSRATLLAKIATARASLLSDKNQLARRRSRTVSTD